MSRREQTVGHRERVRRLRALGNRAFDAGQHHPGVVGQLVAHRPGGQSQTLHRLNEGARSVWVHSQRPERRWDDGDHLGVVDIRFGDGAGDLAECGHQYRHAFAFLGVLVMPVDVEAVAGDHEQPGHGLCALAIASHPEQVGQHAGRADSPGAGAGLRRRSDRRLQRWFPGGHRHRLGPRALRRAYPNILCSNCFQSVCGRPRCHYIADAADHRRIAAALGDREQPHADAGRRQHAGVVGGRRRELRQLLADPLPRHAFDVRSQFSQLRNRKCWSDKGFPADSGLDQQRREIRQ